MFSFQTCQIWQTAPGVRVGCEISSHEHRNHIPCGFILISVITAAVADVTHTFEKLLCLASADLSRPEHVVLFNHVLITLKLEMEKMTALQLSRDPDFVYESKM